MKEKQNACAALSKSTSDQEKEVRGAKYKTAKKLAKKAVIITKNNTFEKLYQKLEINKGEKDDFKLARVRESNIRDLGNVRCIKGDYGKVSVEETNIRGR